MLKIDDGVACLLVFFAQTSKFPVKKWSPDRATLVIEPEESVKAQCVALFTSAVEGAGQNGSESYPFVVTQTT